MTPLITWAVIFSRASVKVEVISNDILPSAGTKVDPNNKISVSTPISLLMLYQFFNSFIKKN
jgi:hypothetical protein